MVIHEDADRPTPSSQLFMLRLWPEDVGSGKTDWRGKIQHVNSGEARYFRDWPTLEAFLEELVHRSEQAAPRADGTEEAEKP